MTTRVVLIRHGESVCNAAGIVGGHTGCTGLTDRGRKQASRLRERLDSTRELRDASALYSSVLERAVETARIISPAVADGTLGVRSVCDLCEMHPGEADGLPWPEFTARYGEPDWESDPYRVVAPGGESWTEFVARARSAVEKVAAENAGKLSVLVCHGGVIEATLLSFLPLDDTAGSKPLRLPTSYSSITEWSTDDPPAPGEGTRRRWRLSRYNDVAHLGGPDEATRDGEHVLRRGPR